MWNISTYQWLQGIRYYTEPYNDPTELMYLPIFYGSTKVASNKLMKVKSMENFKFNCDSYKACCLNEEEEDKEECSTEPNKGGIKTMNSTTYFANLLIQELVTQRKLTKEKKAIEQQADVSGTSTNQVLDRRWTTEEEDNVENNTLDDWALDVNDPYSLDTCLQIVDDSFGTILDDASLSTSSLAIPSNRILDCDDEEVTFEDKDIAQRSAIYQNVFELRKGGQLTAAGGSAAAAATSKRRCLKLTEEELYENIWDFTSIKIKHGSFCRVSTIFDETCQTLVVPVVRPIRCDLGNIIPECVNQWMRDLRYEYCGEEDERDQSMANNQQQGKLSNPSSTTKNSQHDLVPKSPVAKYGADFNSNEANQSPQKTSTNRKTIKHILQKFLSRRPTQQDLVTKGIIQEQRVFGNSLRRLCCTTATAAAAAAAANVGASAPRIPEFVATVVRMIEHERNVVSHGIYRASGNVATIQKIRVRVNEGKNVMDVLQDHKMDVDVLTGSLKLFFRELAEPLISTDMFTELCHLKGKDLTDPDQLYAEVDDIVRQQPAHHKDVLLALIRHILYVISFGDKNSMSIDSMSIVWGPSLIFTDNEEDGGTLLQRMTNNNSIVKFLLNVYSETFTRDTYIASKTHSESTLSLVSTSGKSSTTRASFKQQLSLDYTTSVEDIELLLKAIEKSECAKRINIYVNSKMKKSKKIIERIKAKKSIEKYFTSNDGLCGIVGALKFFVDQSKVVPAAFIGDYDGGTLHAKEIEAALDSLPGTNQQILTMLLNHLNLMANINPDKYSMELLVEAWTKHLFVNSEQTPNAGKYLEQLLIHNEQTANDRREQSTRQKIMLSDLNLNESFRMRGRVSGSDTSLDSEVLTICSGGDVEIRKSVKLHEKEEEQKRNNRNS